jgi:predicted transcriptional regulator
MIPTIEEVIGLIQTSGLSQKRIAQLAGVSQSAITKLVHRKMNPSYDLVRNLYEAVQKNALQSKRQMKAKEIATYKMVTVPKDASLRDASKVMKAHGISQVPVTDGGQFVGTISESIITSQFAEQLLDSKGIERLLKAKVESLMKAPMPIIDEALSVESVAGLLSYCDGVMTSRKGKVVGIITRADFHKLLVSRM